MKPVLALIAALALSACASNQSIIAFNVYDGSYQPGEHSLYGPAIETFVRGAPFPGLPAADALAAILDDMQEGGFPETRFTTDRIGRSPYRVLMLFGPAPGTGLQQLCEIDPATLGRLPTSTALSDGRLGLAAVFCRADRVMSGAIGTLPQGRDAADPVVKGAIQAFMRQLFPASNPSNGGGAGADPP